MRFFDGRVMAATTLLSLGFAAVPASAAIVIANGTSYTPGQTINLAFNGQNQGGVVANLSSTVSLLFTGVNASGDYQFNYVVTNTSSSPHTVSRVTGFGFDTDPNPDLAASSETGPYTRVSSGDIANAQSVEFCITGGNDPSSCASGGNIGPLPGTSFDGSFVLGFAGADPGTITLTDFHTRYQSVSNGTVGNGSASATGFLVPSVPEPGTWAMMLLGFGAVGWSMRRGQRVTALPQLA